jgi:TonB family protein
MQVSAARTLSDFAQRAIGLSALFVFVIALQVGLVTGLRASGWDGGAALGVAGLVVMAVVIAAAIGWNILAHRRIAADEAERFRLGLPDGPCCCVVRIGGGGDEGEFPWVIEGDVAARYPRIARQFGVEGFALVDFEVGADGAARSMHCIDVWPSKIFYESAVEALKGVRFRLREGAAPGFGRSYRIPFVFRIKGAARRKDRGARQARQARPMLDRARANIARLLAVE